MKDFTRPSFQIKKKTKTHFKSSDTHDWITQTQMKRLNLGDETGKINLERESRSEREREIGEEEIRR
ncbi:hypothetical protein HanRHA438_Chr07g0321361 [Helianthus annuus]|nr:hypothetical protein HanRHA438_Chr07g0321361 [Helianthus annuus]